LKQPDVVVIGAGHNSLIASAYLARCGMSVLVLEKHEFPGGGAVSREVTLPGFLHDTHATAPGLLQGSPIVTHDELGLLSKYGLKFIEPKIFTMSAFADGDTLVWYQDLDATCREIAKYSQKDAESYRSIVKYINSVVPLFGLGMIRPPASFGNFVSFLEKTPFGNDLLVTMLKSAYDVVCERMEHPKVRMALLKRYMVTLCHPEEKGTGLNMLFVMASIHAHGLPIVEGGSQNLTRATIRCLEANGGEIRLGTAVKRVINKGGEARSVELEDGSTVVARKAVLASIHPHYLGSMVQGLDTALVERAKLTVSSYFATFMVHLALQEAPQWKAGELVNQCTQIDLIDALNFKDFRRMYDEPRWGQIAPSFCSGASVATIHDPSRAPAGKHVLASYTFVPYDLENGGPERWDEVKGAYCEEVIAGLARYAPNLTGANIMARYAESPLDLQRYSASFTGGDVNGLSMSLYQSMGMRPTPELSQYRVPGANGLYLTGPYMHPGGGLAGGGRAVAMRMLEDMKIDSGKVFRI